MIYATFKTDWGDRTKWFLSVELVPSQSRFRLLVSDIYPFEIWEDNAPERPLAGMHWQELIEQRELQLLSQSAPAQLH